MSYFSRLSGCVMVLLVTLTIQLGCDCRCFANVTREEVERAIREGVRFLKAQQRADGSWSDVENEAKTGTTSLITLALLTAGEKAESPVIRKALDYLRGYGPKDLNSTYAIALQTMVFAAADPRTTSSDRHQRRLAGTRPDQAGDPVNWAGSWTYSDSKRARPGDNSNTQYALLGLNAASEAGVPVKPEVWALSRRYWERSQKPNGGWAYTPDSAEPDRQHDLRGGLQPGHHGPERFQGQESIQGDVIHNCGRAESIPSFRPASTGWPNTSRSSQNFGNGQQWKFYYLYGLERAGRLTGLRFFGRHDWYRMGAGRARSRSGPASGLLDGRTQRGQTRFSPPVSRCCSWPRGGHPF